MPAGAELTYQQKVLPEYTIGGDATTPMTHVQVLFSEPTTTFGDSTIYSDGRWFNETLGYADSHVIAQINFAGGDATTYDGSQVVITNA